MLSLIPMVALGSVLSSSPAFAQETGGESGDDSGGMKETTSGGSLDVLLEPSPVPVENIEQTRFKVTFLQPGSETVQQHIDYDFIITDSNGQQLFSAAEQTGQPVLHTEPGTVTIPFKFENTGDYTIEIQVYGILFQPINPESVEFHITVTPEFPVGVLGTLAAVVVTVAIIMSRGFKMIK